MIEKLTAEQTAELGVVVRACHDLCASLGVEDSSLSILPGLVEGLVGTALSRAKPNRRGAYLDQWQQFLCWLAEALAHTPKPQRTRVAMKAMRSFRLKDWRGRSKPSSPIPTGANCFLLKDGELWYAKVPTENVPPKVCAEPPPPELLATFLAGQEIYKSGPTVSATRSENAEYLRPFYPPGVLKAEYGKLILVLPEGPLNEDRLLSLVTDVPANLLRHWFEDGASREDLALLVASRRAHMTAKMTNLPHLREALRLSR
jgi:hypothetical protein